MRAAACVLLGLALSGGVVHASAAPAYGNLPLAFEENRGQTDARVAFLAHGPGFSAFLSPASATYRLQLEGGAYALRMSLVDARPGAQMRGTARMEGLGHYLAADPQATVSGVPRYARVEVPGAWRGIDLAYHGHGALLEFDFIVNPGADWRTILIDVEGASGFEVTHDGALRLDTPAGAMAWRKPIAYQQSEAGRREVEVAYVVRGSRQLAFHVGEYDRSSPLVIDPVLSYSTLLGGSGADHARAIAVDPAGRAIFTGQAQSPDFPATTGPVPAATGSVFVARLNAAGTALDYSAVLGPGRGTGVALHGGSVFVTGVAPPGFPVTPGALNQSLAGDNVFVAKLSGDGSTLLYSALFGGGLSQGAGIAVDGAGNAHVTGTTQSPSFPTTVGAFQPTRPTLGQTFLGDIDAFYAKLDAAGASLLYATYLGSTDNDFGEGIALDASGRAYVAGSTTGRSASWNGNPAAVAPFPTTAGAYQASFVGGASAFVTKLDPAGAGPASVVYSTLLGGNDEADGAHGIAVDASGSAYVTGKAGATFPRTTGAFGETVPQGAFVTKLDAAGAALVYSAVIGGAEGRGIALDASRNAYVAGVVQSVADFVPVDPLVPSTGDQQFLTKIAASGASAVYSTLIDGHFDVRLGVAVDGYGAAYVAGTAFGAFTATPGAYQSAIAGITDAFVTKVEIPINAILAINLFGSAQGRVTSDDGLIDCSTGNEPTCAARYTRPTTVTLTATTGTGVVFTGWLPPTCAGSGTGPCTLTITDDVIARPRFDIQQVTLAVVVAGNGHVTSIPAGIDCPGTCSVTRDYGASFALSAMPGPGQVFQGWSGDCGGSAMCSATLDAPRTVTATFTPIGVTALSVAPPTVSLTVGGQARLSARASFSDGSTRRLTDRSLESSDNDTCAINASGIVKCMGRSPNPVRVPAFDGAIALAGGTSQMCVLFEGGTVNCEGTVVPLAGPATAIAAQTRITCALLSNGAVQCWDGTSPTPLPANVPGITDAVAIGAEAGLGACVVRLGGSVTCWSGYGDPSDPLLAPAPVPGVLNATAVTYGVAHGCALIADGRVMCWGDNDHGQLGNGQFVPLGSPASPASWVRDANGILTGAIAIAAGDYHACALLANGGAACWGSGLALARASDSPLALPFFGQPPPGFTAIPAAASISAGATLSCVTILDGSVWCMGRGPGFNFVPPTLVAGMDDVLAPSWTSTNAAVAGVMADGTVTGRAAGSANVTASESGASAVAAVSVVAGTGVEVRAVSADPAAPPVTVSFPVASQVGVTQVASAGSCPAAPQGFSYGNPAACFELTSTAAFTPPATVCVTYAPAAFAGSPQLFHFESGAWADVTSSVDTATHVVCGAVSSFSPFALAEPSTGGRLVADAGTDKDLECTSPRGAALTLDGSGSSRGPGITYRWKGPFGSLDGMVVGTTLPVGNHVAQLRVSQGRAHAQDVVKIRIRTGPACRR